MSEYDGEKNPNWQTPGWFLDLVRKVGPIGFDPCTTPSNPTSAREFIAERGGLAATWPVLRPGEVAYINPPYGQHLSGEVDEDAPIYKRVNGKRTVVARGRGWARKIAQYRQPSIVLVPTRTDTPWWNELFDWADATLLWRSSEFGSRIRFVHPDTSKPGKQPNHASTVFFRLEAARQDPWAFFSDDWTRMVSAFGDHGRFID